MVWVHLDNDVVLLEGLVVEKPVQDIFGAGGIPHLCTGDNKKRFSVSKPSQSPHSMLCSNMLQEPMHSCLPTHKLWLWHGR